jgi:hypothetical protein
MIIFALYYSFILMCPLLHVFFAPIWFIRSIHYWNVNFLNEVIIKLKFSCFCFRLYVKPLCNDPVNKHIITLFDRTASIKGGLLLSNKWKSHKNKHNNLLLFLSLIYTSSSGYNINTDKQVYVYIYTNIYSQ